MVLQPGLVDALWLGVLILISGASAWSGALALRDARQAVPAELTAAEKRSIYQSGSAVLWILAAGTVIWWGFAGRDWAALGLGAPRWTWPAACAALGFIVCLAADTARQAAPSRIEGTRQRWRMETPFMPVSAPEFRGYAVLALSAGVWRGDRLPGIHDRCPLRLVGPGMGGSCARNRVTGPLFRSRPRLPGSGAGSLRRRRVALAWGFVVMETGSVVPAVVFHAGWDLFMGYLGLRLMRPSPPDA